MVAVSEVSEWHLGLAENVVVRPLQGSQEHREKSKDTRSEWTHTARPQLAYLAYNPRTQKARSLSLVFN